MSTKERLLQFIEEKGLSVSKFEQLAGLSNGYVRNLKGQIGDKKMKDIRSAFPELSEAWLRAGEELVLRSGVVDSLMPTTSATSEGNTDFKAFLRQVKAKEGITQEQLAQNINVHKSYISDMANGRVPVTQQVTDAILELYPYAKDYLAVDSPVPTTPAPATSEGKLVPLLPVEAVGGRLDGFAADGVMLSNCEKIMSPFGGTDFGMRVKGDSMFPEYPNGCLIFIKRNVSTWIEWGRVYVLDTCDGVVLKQIVKSDLGDDYFCCRSFNVERGYTPFDIPRSDVFGVYRVLGLIAEKG